MAIFFIPSGPPAFSAPVRGSPSKTAIMFGFVKTTTVCLPGGEKKFDDMLNCFYRIPACDGRTDRRTDGHVATA